VQNKAVRFILDLRGRVSVSEAKASLGLENLQDRRRAQRIKMFHRILINSGEHSSYDELNELIESYFKPSRPATRALSQGLPLAVAVNSEAFLNCFITRTARDLRGGAGAEQ
jgi:hypothetical protein